MHSAFCAPISSQPFLQLNSDVSLQSLEISLTYNHKSIRIRQCRYTDQPTANEYRGNTVFHLSIQVVGSPTPRCDCSKLWPAPSETGHFGRYKCSAKKSQQVLRCKRTYRIGTLLIQIRPRSGLLTWVSARSGKGVIPIGVICAGKLARAAKRHHQIIVTD